MSTACPGTFVLIFCLLVVSSCPFSNAKYTAVLHHFELFWHCYSAFLYFPTVFRHVSFNKCFFFHHDVFVPSYSCHRTFQPVISKAKCFNCNLSWSCLQWWHICVLKRTPSTPQGLPELQLFDVNWLNFQHALTECTKNGLQIAYWHVNVKVWTLEAWKAC